MGRKETVAEFYKRMGIFEKPSDCDPKIPKAPSKRSKHGSIVCRKKAYGEGNPTVQWDLGR